MVFTLPGGKSGAADKSQQAVDGREQAGGRAAGGGKTRVWGQRSLAKRSAAAAPTHRNRRVYGCISFTLFSQRNIH